MDKIKTFFSQIWTYVVLALVTIIGGLLFLLKVKDKEVSELKIKLLLVKTEKEADTLKNDVQDLLNDNKRTDVEITQLKDIIVEIEKKKEEFKKPLDPQKVEDYWNH